MSRSSRKTSSPQKLNSEGAWAEITKVAEDLRITRCLNGVQNRRISAAIEISRNVQPIRRRNDYQVFLKSVLREAGAWAVLLCAIALGEMKTITMTRQHRLELVRRLRGGKQNPALNHETIQSLAKPILDVYMCRSTNTTLNKLENDPMAALTVSLDTNNFTPQQHLVREKASPQELPDIFDRSIPAVAAFEDAVLFAAESIPRSDEREAWISSCRDHVRVLKRLCRVNEGNGTDSKCKHRAGQEGQPDASDDRNYTARARSIETTEPLAAVYLQAGNATALDIHPSQPSVIAICQGEATEEASSGGTNFGVMTQAQNSNQLEVGGTSVAFVAVSSEVDRIDKILGEYFSKGMKTSLTRQQEEDRESILSTNTVRLHPTRRIGEDFKLEVMLGFRIGREIWAEAYRNKFSVITLFGLDFHASGFEDI